MEHQWDEFSKSLAERSVARRQTLRLLGAALAGVFLAPFGARTASAAGDPCRAFCKCRNKKQQNACLAACRACSGNTSHLCGSCASGYACTDLASDFDNCGACGYVCEQPGQFERGACIAGRCEYSCFEGAVNCGGTCTFLDDDLENCGACGHVCDEPGPYGWNTYPRSICRHPSGDPQTGHWETVFSVIIEPAARRMHVTRGTPCEHPYETYALA